MSILSDDLIKEYVKDYGKSSNSGSAIRALRQWREKTGISENALITDEQIDGFIKDHAETWSSDTRSKYERFARQYKTFVEGKMIKTQAEAKNETANTATPEPEAARNESRENTATPEIVDSPQHADHQTPKTEQRKSGREPIDGVARDVKIGVYMTKEQARGLKILAKMNELSVASYLVELVKADLKKKERLIAMYGEMEAEIRRVKNSIE